MTEQSKLSKLRESSEPRLLSWRAHLSLALLLSSLSISAQVHAKPSLRGSSASLDRQNRAANRAGLKRHRSAREVMSTVRSGRLVRVRAGAHLELHNVSYPYAHPSLYDFLTRFARFYHKTCGAKLVVTSLTRPTQEQPRNASSRSVHPTGIAADLRLPWRDCRARLEPVLLGLEAERVIEATRERRPPHYHITINPPGLKQALQRGGGALQALGADPRYQAKRTGAQRSASSQTRKRKQKRSRRARVAARRSRASQPHYRVKSGDTLWALSKRWQVSVKAIKSRNQLRSARLQPGQVLKIPHSSSKRKTSRR